MVRIRFPPAVSQLRTWLSREFAFLPAAAAIGSVRLTNRQGQLSVWSKDEKEPIRGGPRASI
jgi:hypothetical protein